MLTNKNKSDLVNIVQLFIAYHQIHEKPYVKTHDKVVPPPLLFSIPVMISINNLLYSKKKNKKMDLNLKIIMNAKKI